MKKVLLIGFILVILLLAFPQGVSAFDAEPVTVTANVQQVMQCTASTPDAQTFARGTNFVNDIFTLTVTSTNNWDLTADDAKSGTDTGHMVPVTPFTPADASALVNPFGIETATEAVTKAVSGDPFSIDMGLGNKAGIARGLNQTIADTDWFLTAGSYQITITFTCTNTDLP